MLIRRILNCLRAIFLALSVGLVATVMLWPTLRPQIERLDDELIWWHTGGPRSRLLDAQKKLRAGETEAARAELESLVDDLEGVRFGDRRSWTRITALEVLAKHLDAVGEDEAALARIEDLLEIDPRDLSALTHRVELVDALGRKDEAFALIETLFAVGSQAGRVQLRYLSGLAERGRTTDVARALIELGPFSPLLVPETGWELRSSDTTSFEGKGRVGVTMERNPETGVYSATAELDGPRAAMRFRADLPTLSLVALDSLRVVLVQEDGSEYALGVEHIVSKRHLQDADGALVAYGEDDPYFVMDVPGEGAEPRGSVPGVVALRLEARVRVELPPDIIEAARAGIGPASRNELVERYGADKVDALEARLDA